MNLHKTINIQRIIIAILLVISIIITLACYKLQLTATELLQENKNLSDLVEMQVETNDRLSRHIQYQQSSITDLEENLKK